MKTLLQKITDTLEAGGIPVSAIETYPPNKDRAVSVSLTVQEKAESLYDELWREEDSYSDIQESLAHRFIRYRAIFDEGYCELAANVYRAYKSGIKPNSPTLLMTEGQFFRFMKEHHSKYNLEYMTKAGDMGTSLYFSNLLLKRDLPQKTPTEDPCHSCAENECENCPCNPANNDRIKLYAPEEAVEAMMAGKTLKNKKGWLFYWGGDKFTFKDNEGELHHIWDFSGLYSERGIV